MTIFWGLIIPFIGTTAGAACVLFMKNELKPVIQKALLGFAAGVMVAASVWSLLIPAMDMSGHMGKFAFAPAAIGFIMGIVFLLLLDRIIPHLHIGSDESEGPRSTLKKSSNPERGPWQGQGLPVWIPVRHRGADCRRDYHIAGSIHHAHSAISFGLCGRSHDLCSGGGTHSGIRGRRAQQYRDDRICRRIRIDDDIGCGVRIGGIMRKKISNYLADFSGCGADTAYTGIPHGSESNVLL